MCLSSTCVDAGNGTDSAAVTTSANDDDDGDDDDDDTSGTDDGSATESGGETGPQSTAGGEPGGPTIVSLDLNVSNIEPGQAFTVSAIVTDPDGVDDVIGGQLQSGDGQVVFDTFETQAQEGAYSVIITFEQIGQAVPGSGTASSESREFRAEFFDQSGASSWQTVPYTVECDAGYLCDDQCLDVECIPDLVPCDDDSPCIEGSCTPKNGAGGLGEPCNSQSQCSTLCWVAQGMCGGAWCDAAGTCPAGQHCQGFQTDVTGTDTCHIPPLGVCWPD